MIEALPPPPREPAWCEFARAPLLPVALGAAVGLAADRAFAIPVEAGFLVAVVAIVASFWNRSKLVLAVAFAGLAAVHHHSWRHDFAVDDLGNFATDVPAIVKVRGFLAEQPTLKKAHRSELFGPARRVDRASTVLDASEISLDSSWQPASGRVKVIVERDVANEESGLLDTLAVGDEVEMVGLLSKPSTPGNPSERDYASYLLDQRIRCELRITKGAEAVTRLNDSAGWSWARSLAAIRARLTAVLRETTPASDTPLARALLLGDTAAMDRDDWDAFARTGVLHVLAISGQHLVILAGAVWLLLRVFGVRRRRGAWLVLALIIVYAALTGGRPSAVRAAVMVTILCGAIIARRPPSLANTFCLAWIVVVAINPADAASFGSLLSFLSVFVLIWGAGRWLEPRELTPIEQLRHDARPPWLNALRAFLRWIYVMYAITVILMITNTPLIMSAQNIVPVVSLLIGPPLVLLTTIALLSGFAQMIVGLASPLLALPFGFITGESLSLSQAIVEFADRVPVGTVYVPNVPSYWLIGFYAILIVMTLTTFRWRKRLAITLAAWTLLALIPSDRRSDEMRVTFLSVGHGGCAVIETPDGRVLLYDAGTMAGPDIVKRVVAPYLWSRGIRRIDELFLSHSDLDHYNAVPQLLRRFPVGQVTMSPSFATKPVAEVAEVLLAFEKHAVPTRVASRGDLFKAGDVTIEVLHPPAEGLIGTENERSMVLKVTHQNHTILFTGDLEKSGTTMLLATTPQAVDVLMAPHHGSAAAYPEMLNRWATPRLVVVSRGPLKSVLVNAPDAWDTWSHGAITLHSHATGLSAETFKTKQRVVVKRGK